MQRPAGGHNSSFRLARFFDLWFNYKKDAVVRVPCETGGKRARAGRRSNGTLGAPENSWAPSHSGWAARDDLYRIFPRRRALRPIDLFPSSSYRRQMIGSTDTILTGYSDSANIRRPSHYYSILRYFFSLLVKIQ